MDILTGVAFRNDNASIDGAFLVSAKAPRNGRESATLSMAAQVLAALAASAQHWVVVEASLVSSSNTSFRSLFNPYSVTHQIVGIG
jgi:hypothetical protein